MLLIHVNPSVYLHMFPLWELTKSISTSKIHNLSFKSSDCLSQIKATSCKKIGCKMLSHPPKWRFLPKSSAMNFRPSMGDDAWVPTLSFSLLVFRIHSKAGSSGAHEDNETEGSNLGSAETVPGESSTSKLVRCEDSQQRSQGGCFFHSFCWSKSASF